MSAKNTTPEQSKDTGLAMVLLLLLAWYLTRNESLALAAMAVLVVTMTWPLAFRPLARLWFGLSHVLGSIVSKVLLSLVFFLVATPIGVARRLGGADAMRLKGWKRGDCSAFVDRNQAITAGDLEKPY